MEVSTIGDPVVLHGRRNMEVANLLSVWVTIQITQPTIVPTLRTVLRIPGDLVNKIALMKHKIELLIGRGALVFKDHSPIGILRALCDILATDERKFGAVVGRFERSSTRPSDATANPLRIRKP